MSKKKHTGRAFLEKNFALIKDATAPLRICDDVDIIGISRSAPGVSRSWILLGRSVKNGCVMVVKIEHTKDTGMRIEREYYRELIPKMAVYTPHLLRTVRADCEIPNFAKVLSPSEIALSLFKKKRLPRKVAALFLQIAQGITLTTLLEHKRPSWSLAVQREFDRDICIQVARTLLVFAHFRFRHNDLHTGNVLCEILSSPKRLGYKVQNKEFSTRFPIRIIDFDRSTVDPRKNKQYPANDEAAPQGFYCQHYGQCQSFVRNWDWYFFLQRFLAGIEEMNGTTDIAEQTNFHEPTEKEVRVFGGSPCECANPRCARCVLAAKRLKTLVSPRAFLEMV